MVDVSTSIIINQPVRVVADYAADPQNAMRWYKNIRSSRLITDPPLRRGSQIAFAARFLGRDIIYTYEVKEFTPGKKLVMATHSGPFAMETTYLWESVSDGATKMTLRNRGNPSGFSAVVAPFLAAAMKQANKKDLALLKHQCE